MEEKNIELIRFHFNDNQRFTEILAVYNKNLEHLKYWHNWQQELLFEDINAIKKYLIKYDNIWYALYFDGVLVGCIETGILRSHYGKKCRHISFWIDKEYTRKGIIAKALLLTEKTIAEVGCERLTANAVKGNVPSENLIKKFGYKQYATDFLVLKNEKINIAYNKYAKELDEYKQCI